MNIVTSNQEAFGTDNTPKRNNHRPNRRKLIDAVSEQNKTAKANPQAATNISATPNNSAANQGNKTVFYQAARPKQANIGPRPHFGMPPRTNMPEHNDTPRPTTYPSSGMNTGTVSNQGQPAHRPFGGLSPIKPITPQNTGIHKLRVIPIGGLQEIGKNMTVFEYGNDIIIVDMGFLFPDSSMLGVDYIIPDVSYLDDKKDRIRGTVITHGHLDHIGAIPYLVERLGFPTMYGTPVTMGLVKQRLEEFNLVGKNKVIVIDPEKDVIQLGVFRIKPFRLVHSVPGAIGLEIETPNGRMVYTTDWRFDYNPADGKPIDFRDIAAIGSRGVDLFMSDSTNAERPGFSMSEKFVEAAIASAIEESKGRVIVAMFASNLNRIQQTINAANKCGRKVVIVGRSLLSNVEMAVNLQAIKFPQNTLIADREMGRFTDEKLLVICTGAQGEERSALNRMASGEHRTIKIKKGDTAIISASPIPGNEKSVGGVMDMLYKAGANVIYNKTLDVHTTGHANQEELKLMLALLHPKYFLPLHGERNKRIVHGKLAVEVGVAEENIILGDNGTVIELDTNGKVSVSNEQVPAGDVIVDGLGVGDVGSIVLSDRKAMAHEGIFVVITVFDSKKRSFITSPDIISRGFIYMRENEKFINDIRTEIKKLLNHAVEEAGEKLDMNTVKNEMRDFLTKVLFQKTEREPMVIPVIIEV